MQPKIAQQIPDEIDSHNEWVNMLGVVPVIRALREKAMNIQSETMESIDQSCRIFQKEKGLFQNIQKVLLTKC